MPYQTLPAEETIIATETALREKGFDVHRVATGIEALTWIQNTIPAGASVHNGSSQTLQQIGLVDYLKSNEHPWKNLHALALQEADPVKKARLSKEAVLADWYLGSVHAVSQTGELVIASASGSQLPSIVFTSDNVILVVSTKKITPTIQEALVRLHEVVVPQEDARMKTTGAPGTVVSKTLIYERHPGWGRTVHVVLVNEDLGF